MNRGIKIMMVIMVLGLVVAFFWQQLPFIKNSVHAVLNPTIGKLLDVSPQGGFILIVLIISLITTGLQRFTTDQALLKSIKQEQKMLQEQMKQYKDNPEKTLELGKKQWETAMKTMDITLRPALFTAIPFILFFRWFGDYFTTNPVTFFGFMSWIWAFLLMSIIFSMILRKVFKLP